MLAPEPEGQGKEGERERRIASESLLIRDYGDDAAVAVAAAAAATTSATPFAIPDITLLSPVPHSLQCFAADTFRTNAIPILTYTNGGHVRIN